jgi:hypothetical protein
MASMNEKRVRCSVIALPNSNEIIVIGGFDGNKTLNTVELFNFESNTWNDLSTMHHARSHFGAFLCPLSKFIYVIGGQV